MRAASIQLLLAQVAYAADIDDEYHHTQLLQAKVKPGKAVIAHTDKVPGLLQTGTNRVRACTIGADESCFLAADNLWEPEDIPGYFGCLSSCCQDYDPDLIFDGITCDDIIAMGFTCTDEVPGNHIPEGTTLADVCSHTCDPSCEVELAAPAPDLTVGGGCTVAAGENCYLAEDNLWQPEDIPGYFDCLQECCQDFDPDRIFDGTTCDDIITAFGFGCDDEVPELNHIPAGTTVAAFCPGSCGACGADGVSLEPVVPDLDFGDSSLVVPSSATYGRPTYSSWSDWNMSHGGNYSNWSDWNWTYGNWSYGNWSYGNWSYGNWSYWNWTSGNWSDWNWSSGNWSSGNWSDGNWSSSNGSSDWSDWSDGNSDWSDSSDGSWGKDGSSSWGKDGSSSWGDSSWGKDGSSSWGKDGSSSWGDSTWGKDSSSSWDSGNWKR